MSSSSSSSSSFRFWALVAFAAIGSISCFGYAGVQMAEMGAAIGTGTVAASAITRQFDDSAAAQPTSVTMTMSEKLRSPISFSRDSH